MGHKKKNTSLFSSWYLYKLRTDIWIINLYKTIWMLKLIYVFIKYLISTNKSIWFINMDLLKQDIINKYAYECGEFPCTSVWLRGFLSNYFSIYPVIKKYLVQKYIYKNDKLYTFYCKWHLTRNTWPRAIYISALKDYTIICKEALSLFIPIIGILDTNIKHQYFNFPIPGNDDGYSSLIYISSLLSKFILVFKYKKLIVWWSFSRYKKSYKRLLSLLILLKQRSMNYTKNYIKGSFNHLNKLFIFNYIKEKSYIKINSLLNMIFKYRKRFKIILKPLDNLSTVYTESLNFFYLNIINIGWYKKYMIYRNRWKLKKPSKKYYLLHFFQKKFSKRMKHIKWFIKLYYYTILHYFRNFLDTSIFTNFMRLVRIKKFFFGVIILQYMRRKERWFQFVSKRLFVHTSRLVVLDKFIKKLYSNINRSFFFFYYNLFIKFFNKNLFNFKIQKILLK